MTQSPSAFGPSGSKGTSSRVLHAGLRLSVVLLACCAMAACGFFRSVDQQVARARSHFEAGQYRSAMAEVKTALEREPQHAQARLLLAQLSLWLGDLDAAEDELARARDAGVPAQDASELHYELLLARGRYDELLASLANEHALAPPKSLLFEARAHEGRKDAVAERRALEQALKAAPEDPGVLLQMARLDAESGELKRALEITAKVAQPPLMQARALQLRGLIFRSRGEHSESRDALSRAYDIGRKYLPVPEQVTLLIALTDANLALNDAEGARKTVERLATWAPTSVATYYLRARVALLKNDPVTAVAECQRALQVSPHHAPSEMLLAVAHLSHGSFEQAEGVLNGVLSSDPGNVAATKLLAQVYLGRGQPEQARRLLSGLAERSQSDAQIDWLMGAALLQSGDADGLSALERGQTAAPNDLGKRVDLAYAYIVSGVPAKAIPLLKTVPAGAPQSARAQSLMVMASVSGKSPQDASHEIDGLVAADPGNAALLTAAGAQLARMGEARKSKDLLERALRLDPGAVGARWTLAQLAARAQDVQRAEELLRAILTIDPANQLAHLGLAELAWRRGDRAQAQDWLEKAVGKNPAAVEPRLRLAQIAFVAGDAPRGKNLLDQAIRISTDRGGVLNAAAQVLSQAGFVEEALARYKEATAAGAAEGSLNAARLYEETGRIDEGRQLLEAALADRPDWREATRLLLELDARNGRVDQALARVRSMTELSPAASLEYQGDVYVWARHYPNALGAYEDAQRKQPSAALAMKMFNVQRAAGAPSPQLSLLEWLQNSPADADVRRLLAAHYESTGRQADAAAEYEKLLATGRIDPVSLNNLAWILQSRGDARAVALAKRAYDAAPQIPAIADTYGWILVQTDKVRDGIVVLERALAGASANPDIQYHVAAAYVKSGQAARGAEILREVLQAHEKFASRQEAEQLMQSLSTGAGGDIPKT
jgi:putative PEP-CTERM system TPR-repeat lipoprotein